MRFLQRLLTFLTCRHSAREKNPPQAVLSTSIFNGVGSVTIIGGTFIVNGTPHAPSYFFPHRIESIDPGTPTYDSEGVNVPTTAGTQMGGQT